MMMIPSNTAAAVGESDVDGPTLNGAGVMGEAEGVVNGCCYTPVTDPDSIALLAAMHEANRQLEADDRSMSVLPSPLKQQSQVSVEVSAAAGSSDTSMTGQLEQRVIISDDTDTQTTIQQLCERIQQLETVNKQLSEATNADVELLREELIACKVREAENDLLTKELKQKVMELDKVFQRHVELVNDADKLSSKLWRRSKMQELSAELVAVQLRETSLTVQLNEMKQEALQLETVKRVYERQVKRLSEENSLLAAAESDWTTKEKSLDEQIHELERQLDHLNTRSQEEAMMSRIRDAEYAQTVAEMKQRIADLEIQNQELLTAETLHMSTIDDAISDDADDSDDTGDDDDNLEHDMLRLRLDDSCLDDINAVTSEMTSSPCDIADSVTRDVTHDCAHSITCDTVTHDTADSVTHDTADSVTCDIADSVTCNVTHDCADSITCDTVTRDTADSVTCDIADSVTCDTADGVTQHACDTMTSTDVTSGDVDSTSDYG